MYVLGAIAVILAVVFVAVRVYKGGLAGLYTKTLASIAFVVLGLYGAYVNGLTIVSAFILLGLIFGMLGDIVLDLKVIYKEDSDNHLNAGMLCFGIGHIMYFFALTFYAVNSFALYSRKISIVLIPLGIALMVTLLITMLAKPLLKLDFGKFTIQTTMYTFILSLMTAYAFTAGAFVNKWLIYAVGLLLIFISDLILSNQYFGGKQDNKVYTALNHIIYYMGQIIIATSIFFI